MNIINFYISHFAASSSCPSQINSPIPASCLGLSSTSATSSQLQSVLGVVFAILGVVAVLFIVIGGIQFMTSGGSSEQTNKAKNTILYAVIGLMVAVSAELIVNFVLFKIKGI